MTEHLDLIRPDAARPVPGRPPTHDPDSPSAPLAPPYADLYAHPSFRIRSDHEQKRLYVSGFVGNAGNAPPQRAVKVAVGITVRIAGVLISTEKVVTMGQGLRPGDLEPTLPQASAPLAYFNEDNGAKYTFEILVDFHHDVIDLSRANNYYSYTWWAIDPKELVGDEPRTFGNAEEFVELRR